MEEHAYKDPRSLGEAKFERASLGMIRITLSKGGTSVSQDVSEETIRAWLDGNLNGRDYFYSFEG